MRRFFVPGDACRKSFGSRSASRGLRLCLAVALCGFAFPVTADEPAKEEPAKEDDYIKLIFLANADGSEMKPLANVPEYKTQGSPDWSEDGKLIAFDAWRNGENFALARIFVVNADGTNPRMLGDGCMPSFSPRGNRIAFSRASPDHGVWVMSSEGPEKELVLIDDRGWGTDWSPDGTKIAYTKSSKGGANLVVFDIVEGVREFVFDEENTPYRQIYWNFAWSPDSRSIVFKGTRPDGTNEIAIVDARGAKHGLKTRYIGNPLPAVAWGRENRILICNATKERGNRVQLYFLDPTTEDAPVLLTHQDENRALQDTVFSPDGKKLAIAGYKPAPKPKPKADEK